MLSIPFSVINLPRNALNLKLKYKNNQNDIYSTTYLGNRSSCLLQGINLNLSFLLCK